MHMIDVIELLKDKPLEDLDEFCHEFNSIVAKKRLKVTQDRKSLLNVGDLVKVKIGAPEGYAEMYVKKLNPKKAVCLRGDEKGRIIPILKSKTSVKDKSAPTFPMPNKVDNTVPTPNKLPSSASNVERIERLQKLAANRNKSVQ